MAEKFKYFTLKELCKSDTAEARNIENFPTFEIVEHLSVFVEYILDPLREAWGSAIKVTSGFRNDIVNALVGGSDTSVHKLGWAVDLQPMNGDFEGFKYFVQVWLTKNNKMFDQLLVESDSKGNQWIHIGLFNNTGQQRKQIKTMYVA